MSSYRVKTMVPLSSVSRSCRNLPFPGDQIQQSPCIAVETLKQGVWCSPPVRLVTLGCFFNIGRSKFACKCVTGSCNECPMLVITDFGIVLMFEDGNLGSTARL